MDQLAHGQCRNIVGTAFQIDIAIGFAYDDASDL